MLQALPVSSSRRSVPPQMDWVPLKARKSFLTQLSKAFRLESHTPATACTLGSWHDLHASPDPSVPLAFWPKPFWGVWHAGP